LKENKNCCSALYILGDLFEVWIGDDATSELEILIAESLSNFSDNTPVYFLHGNRDFLIRESYTNTCNINIIKDHHTLELKNEKILLLHGDTLCTDDSDYQQFRTLVRDKAWQDEFLSKTISERTSYATSAREKSQTATAVKKEYIMDVNDNAARELFINHNLTKIIHGHTHRPAVHDLTIKRNDNSKIKAQRVVLGDWDKFGWYAEIKDGKLSLNSFKLSD